MNVKYLRESLSQTFRIGEGGIIQRYGKPNCYWTDWIFHKITSRLVQISRYIVSEILDAAGDGLDSSCIHTIFIDAVKCWLMVFGLSLVSVCLCLSARMSVCVSEWRISWPFEHYSSRRKTVKNHLSTGKVRPGIPVLLKMNGHPDLVLTSGLVVVVVMVLVVSTTLALPEPEAGLPISDLHRYKRMAQQGGKCTTSAECVAPNVCSKWGWCQWTTIYGQDGPSQGQAAPGQGRSGQCVTSADCASRVPYCSKLGFCHGGRLPFDEVQLEIEDQVFQSSPEEQPQGYINNNPRKNSPIFKNNANPSASSTDLRSQKFSSSNEANGSTRSNTNGNNNGPNQGQNQRNQRPQQSNGSRSGGRRGGQKGQKQANDDGQRPLDRGYDGQKDQCPGENRASCLEVACEPLKNLSKVFQACQRECNERCWMNMNRKCPVSWFMSLRPFVSFISSVLHTLSIQGDQIQIIPENKLPEYKRSGRNTSLSKTFVYIAIPTNDPKI